ncbi:uncharacterized protein LOC132048883 [Lycium ferocissimum]|uniref:uncharacterized protein LOC132048883 n=1 Tax=Lycium ferocissimum TaxID=112874 RepID=UPI002815708C|nr:uncharacterized protein LOC132048883 [Lycium ferocissimum]
MNTDQQLTLKLYHQDLSTDFIATFLYAKCVASERLELWDSLYHLESSMELPWMVGGDFNIILSEKEKLGGLPVTWNESEDFAFCIKSCELFDVGFKGSLFTWWNGRSAADCIFKRVDRVVVNQQFQNLFANIEVEHLSRTGSDHTPLLLSCGDEIVTFTRPFRFLNFWINHDSFKELITQNWSTEGTGSPYLKFKLKLKKLKRVLSQWSRDTFGDIFQQLALREQVIKIKEALFEEDPSVVNRIVIQKAQAEVKQYLHIEEQYWKQNAGSQEKAVFGLSGDSASGPDGFTGLFYQHCWEIIGNDVHQVILSFFDGNELPKAITHTNLVLIPKKHHVQSFSDLRPISLSNFINKIISRVVHGRTEKLIPYLISSNQSGFVKGRSNFKNIVLTQEIVSDIRIRGKPANVIIKLDMAKAYDKVSWKYRLHRGQARGPLSPTLFLLAAEILSRALNSLFDDQKYIGYGMPKWSNPFNHLAYADDTIIFASAYPESLRRVMKVLKDYEQISGQLINNDKSSFYLHSKVGNGISQSVRDITGFSKGQFPLTYLGCPIFHTRKRKDFYSGLIKRVKERLHSWKGKLLSFGGKSVLIKSVLQTMPVHLLSVLVPPKCVLNELHKIFARFFWSNKEGGRSRHWIAWKDLCLPTKEGGLGFKSLFDVSNALFAKLWWRFRTTNSLWANYMWNKYCKKKPPNLVQWKGGSQVRKKMLVATEEIENEIWWEIKAGTTNIWHENWTKLGALYHVVPDSFLVNENLTDVSELIEDGKWNDSLLQLSFSNEIVDHIKEDIHVEQLQGNWDRPWWMPTPNGNFIVNSAWNILRNRGEKHEDFDHLWIQGIPFKVSFLIWRLWKHIISTDDNLRRIRIPIVSRCYCCESHRIETMQHLFLGSRFARGIWEVFLQAAGLQVNMVQLHQVIKHCWRAKCGEKLKPIVQAIPAMIIWELWKRRNTIGHRGRVSFRKVVHEVNNSLFYLTKIRYPWLNSIPFLWPEIVAMLDNYNPRIITKVMYWKLPPDRWFKCNTDGATRGNPGDSSYGFCVRNWLGDLLYAQSETIGESTNVIAEAKAILEGIKYSIDMQLLPLIVETDSLLLKNMVEGEWKVPWGIISYVERIKRLKEMYEVKIQHVYREGTLKIHSFSELPSAGRKLLNLDKHELPNLRISIDIASVCGISFAHPIEVISISDEHIRVHLFASFMEIFIEEDNQAAEKKSRGNSTIMGANFIEEAAPHNKKRKKSSGQRKKQNKKKFKGNCYNCGKARHKAPDY